MSEAHVYCQKRDLYGFLMAPFLYRRALQMRSIGLLRRPDLSTTTGLVSAGSWRLGCCLNRTSSQKPVILVKDVTFTGPLALCRQMES